MLPPLSIWHQPPKQAEHSAQWDPPIWTSSWCPGTDGLFRERLFCSLFRKKKPVRVSRQALSMTICSAPCWIMQQFLVTSLVLSLPEVSTTWRRNVFMSKFFSSAVFATNAGNQSEFFLAYAEGHVDRRSTVWLVLEIYSKNTCQAFQFHPLQEAAVFLSWNLSFLFNPEE